MTTQSANEQQTWGQWLRGWGTWSLEQAMHPIQIGTSKASHGALQGSHAYALAHEDKLAGSLNQILSKALLDSAPTALYEVRDRLKDFKKGPDPFKATALFKAFSALNEQYPELIKTKFSEEEQSHLTHLLEILNGSRPNGKIPEQFTPWFNSVDRAITKLIGDKEGTIRKLHHYVRTDLEPALCSQPHPLLKQCHQAIQVFQPLYSTTPKEQLRPLWEECMNRLTHLSHNKEHAFLTQNQWKIIAQDTQAINKWIQSKKRAYRPEPIQIWAMIEKAYKSQQGIVDRVGNVLVSKIQEEVMPPLVKAPKQIITELEPALCSQPHPLLKQSHQALQAFQMRYSNTPKEQLRPLWKECKNCLTNLSHNKKHVPLTQDEWKTIKKDKRAINKWIKSKKRAYRPDPIQMGTMIEKAYKSQQGVADKMGDVLVSKLKEEIIPSLVKAPGQMIADIFGSTPTSSTGATAPAVSLAKTGETKTSEPQTFSHKLLEQAGGVLNSCKDHISKKAISGIGTLMEFAFNKVVKKKHNPKDQRIIEAKIKPLREEIETARKEGSWDQLYKTLISSTEVMGEHIMLFQGIRLPINGKQKKRTSAIPDLLNNIATHQRVLKQEEPEEPIQITPKMVAQEALKFKTRAAAFLPIKLVSEWICSFQTTDQFFADLLAIPASTTSEQWQQTFRNQFFEKIDKADIFIARKWMAKALFHTISPISAFFTQNFFDRVMASVDNWKTKDDPTNPRDIEIIGLLRNWLAILSSSYTQAAHVSPKKAKDFKEMLAEALQSPAHNHGLKPQEVYAAFAQAGMEVFGPKFEWRNRLNRYWKTTPPAQFSSPVFDPLYFGLQTIFRSSVNALIWFPEWTCNQLLHKSTKLFLRYNTLLHDKVETTLQSLSHPTPLAHSFNQVLFKQLQKVRDIIRINFSTDPSQKKPKEIVHSEAKKRAVSDLIEYLFEVLNKSRYNTPDKLKGYLNGDLTVKERLEKEIESLFLPKALETGVKTILTAVETLSFDELIYHGLTIANQAFEPTQSVTKKEFNVLESGISELIDQILESSIFYALNDAFDFKGKKQKKEIHRFFRGFKKDIAECITAIKKSMNESPYRFGKTAIEHNVKLQNKHLNRLSNADGNPNFHSETKQKLNAHSAVLARKCKKLGDLLDSVTRIQDKSSQWKQGQKWLEECVHHSKHFIQTLSNHTRKDNTLPIATLALQNFSNAIQKYSEAAYSPLVLKKLRTFEKDLKKQYEEIKTKHAELQLIHLISLQFDRFKTDMQRIIATNKTEISKEKAPTLSLIAKLSDKNLQHKILPYLKRLEKAENQLHVGEADKTFKSMIKKIMPEKEKALDWDRSELEDTVKELKLQAGLEKKQSLKKIQEYVRKINKKTRQIDDRLNNLKKWKNNLLEIPIISFLPFDMGWISDSCKQIGFELGNAKISQIRKAISQKHNYTSALNQLIIFPFLNKYAKHYLKDKK